MKTSFSLSFLFIIIIAISVSSCKSGKETTSTSSAKLIPKAVVRKWNEVPKSYEWFSAKAKMQYSDSKGGGQSFTANIRYRKDSIIWMSFTGFLGIEGGRALITKDSVKIIDRLNKRYYNYPIDFLEQFIPFPLGINDIQAILLGDKFYNHTSRPSILLDNNLYHISAQDKKVEGNYWLNDKNYNMSEMRLKDKVHNRQLIAKFGDYQTLVNRPFSFDRLFEFENGSEKVNVEMIFTKIKVNEPQDFPFSVSNSYKRNP